MVAFGSHILKKHENPSSIEPFLCDGCSLVLAYFNLLQEHVQMYHPAKVMRCSNCEFSNEDEESLKSHMTECHVGMEEGGHKCTQCDFVVATDLLLKEHNQIKHMEPKVNLNEEVRILHPQLQAILSQLLLLRPILTIEEEEVDIL